MELCPVRKRQRGGGVRLAQISPSPLYNSLPNVKMYVFSKILEIFQSSSASPHCWQFDIVSYYWLISGSYRYRRPCQVSLMKKLPMCYLECNNHELHLYTNGKIKRCALWPIFCFVLVWCLKWGNQVSDLIKFTCDTEIRRFMQWKAFSVIS